MYRYEFASKRSTNLLPWWWRYDSTMNTCLKTGQREVLVPETAAEFLVHVLFAQVGDMTDHAGKGKRPGIGALRVVVIAVVPVRISFIDGLAPHLVQGDTLRGKRSS